MNVLPEYHKIVNCQQASKNSHKKFASWERCDGRFPNRLWQKHEFNCVSLFVLSIIVISLLKRASSQPNFRIAFTELHSNGTVV